MYTKKGQKLLRKVTDIEQAVVRGTVSMDEIKALKKELVDIRTQFVKDMKDALGADRLGNLNKFSTVTVADMDKTLYSETMKKITSGIEKLSSNI
jgi:hypothetical protein